MRARGSATEKCFNGLKWNRLNKDLCVAFTVQIGGKKKKSASEISRHDQMHEKRRLSEFEGTTLGNHFTVAVHCLRRNLSKCRYSQIHPEQENSGCHRIPTTLID